MLGGQSCARRELCGCESVVVVSSLAKVKSEDLLEVCGLGMNLTWSVLRNSMRWCLRHEHNIHHPQLRQID
jgi:predicted alpha/beta hydrolase